MILGTESYTSFSMVPKGMSYNPYNKLLFIWGNFLLQRWGGRHILPPQPHQGGGPFLIHQVFSFNFTMSRSYEDCNRENTS